MKFFVVFMILSQFTLLPVLGSCENNFNRPCPKFGIECIRHYFQDKSPCSSIIGSYDNTLTLNNSVLYLPCMRATIMQNPVSYSNLNDGEIEEFAIDKSTNNLIMTINFKNLLIKALSTIHVYQTGKPISTISTNTTEVYPSFVATIIFKNASKPMLKYSVTRAEIPEPMSCFDYKPGTSDPSWCSWFDNLFRRLNMVLPEMSLARAPAFTSYFIQNNICDYGCSRMYDANLVKPCW